jgi:biopolymer transport protein ExbD
MALRTLGGSHGHGEGDESFAPPIVAEINITPLTDVFLVLLIIFMVTSSVLSQMGIQVQLPKSNQASEANQSPGVIVTVNSEGQIFLNGSPVDDAKLGPALQAALAKSADKTVILEGDRRAVLGTVVHIMDEGKKAGASRFAVATKGGKE